MDQSEGQELEIWLPVQVVWWWTGLWVPLVVWRQACPCCCLQEVQWHVGSGYCQQEPGYSPDVCALGRPSKAVIYKHECPNTGTTYIVYAQTLFQRSLHCLESTATITVWRQAVCVAGQNKVSDWATKSTGNHWNLVPARLQVISWMAVWQLYMEVVKELPCTGVGHSHLVVHHSSFLKCRERWLLLWLINYSTGWQQVSGRILVCYSFDLVRWCWGLPFLAGWFAWPGHGIPPWEGGYSIPYDSVGINGMTELLSPIGALSQRAHQARAWRHRSASHTSHTRWVGNKPESGTSLPPIHETHSSASIQSRTYNSSAATPSPIGGALQTSRLASVSFCSWNNHTTLCTSAAFKAKKTEAWVWSICSDPSAVCDWGPEMANSCHHNHDMLVAQLGVVHLICAEALTIDAVTELRYTLN